MRRSLLFTWTALLLQPACAEVEILAPDTCGNGVVERPREDCDIHENAGFACVPPGEPWQCSYACDAQGRCPPGYGCGTDGVCRKPQVGGGFLPDALAEVPSQAVELRSGDFDADGRADVVGVEPGRVRIHFFGASGDVQQAAVSTVVRPSIGKLGPLTRPADSDAAIDETDDLALNSNLGLTALLSQGDRTFSPKAYGSVGLNSPAIGGGAALTVLDVLPLAFDAVPADGPQHTGDETAALFAFLDPANGELPLPYGVFARFGADGTGIVFPVAGGMPWNVQGAPVTGNFDGDACEEIAFPIHADGALGERLRVYKSCTKVQFGFKIGWMQTMVEEEAVLADIQLGASLAGPAFTFDANDDGLQDLIISAHSKEEGYHLRVAYTLGDGTFSSVPPPPEGDPPPPPFVGDNAASVYALLPTGAPPLALGDINLDGFPDVVGQAQVLIGSPAGSPPVTFTTTYTSQRPWTQAVIRDINGNGYPDVVACNEGAPNVDILNGNPSMFFNPAQISTDGTVGNLTVGDHDGDLVNDLVFKEVLSADSTRLVVAFGRTSGGPEDPQEVGELESIHRIVNGSVHTFGKDAIDDLGVISVSKEQGYALSFFPGAGNRILQAPFLLTSPGTDKINVPLVTGLGALRPWAEGEAAHNDVVALALEPPDEAEGETPAQKLDKYLRSLRLWGLFGQDDADFDTDASSSCELPYGALSIPGFEASNVVVVAQSPLHLGAPAFVSVPLMTDPLSTERRVGSALMRAFISPGAPCAVDDPPLWAGPGKMLSRVQTAHLNDNDLPEIIAIRHTYDPDVLVLRVLERLQQADGQNGMTGAPPTPDQDSLIAPDAAEVVIFWDGHLGEKGELAPYVPASQPAFVTDYAVGHMDEDDVLDLVLVSPNGHRTYTLGDDGVSLRDGPPATADLAAQLAEAHAVELADADGDGVNDLCVVSKGLRFYKGIARPEVVNE